jgi:hypothetical protein
MDIGSRDELAFSIGEKQSSTLRVVDIWLNSVLITYFDNSAYLPTFVHSLERELEDIKSGLIHRDYVFFDHGPTTDDVIARAKLIGNQIYFNCELDNGSKVEAYLPVATVVTTYKKCISLLGANAT